MTKKKYRSILLLILMLSVIFVFTACTTRNTDPNQRNDMGLQNGTRDMTDRQDMTGQGQNLMGENPQGTNPEVNRMGAPDNTRNRTQNGIPNGIDNGNNDGANNGINNGLTNGTNNGTTIGRDGAVAPPGTNTGQTRTPQLQQDSLADYGRRADIIRDKLEAMNEVENVTVVVMGNNALVGYTSSNKSRNNDTTKNAIIKKVKDTDKAIENVTVTDALDLTKQLNRISEDIRNNRPIDQINASIDKIMRQITPNSR